MKRSTIIPKCMLFASLAVLAGVVTILAQSYFFVDDFQFKRFELITGRGCIYLSADKDLDPTPHERWQLKSRYDDPLWDMGFWTQRFLGFSWTWWECKEFGIHFVGIPLWFIAFFPAGIAARSVQWLRAGRRLIKSIHCKTCGYDLRATPDRCPECGVATGNR
jgi:hypothetical protein